MRSLGPPLLDRVCGSLELGHIYMLRRDGDSLSSSWAMTMLKLVARHIVPASGAVAVPRAVDGAVCEHLAIGAPGDRDCIRDSVALRRFLLDAYKHSFAVTADPTKT